MKIAVDIDDVLADFVSPFLNYYNSRFKTNFKKDDFSLYTFWNVLGITREQAVAIVNDFYKTPAFRDLPVYEGAVEAIRELKDSNELYVLTSRRSSYRRGNRGMGRKEFSWSV